jgi:hypothetical protein
MRATEIKITNIIYAFVLSIFYFILDWRLLAGGGSGLLVVTASSR